MIRKAMFLIRYNILYASLDTDTHECYTICGCGILKSNRVVDSNVGFVFLSLDSSIDDRV